MIISSKRPWHRSAGFTLVELLVALTLLALVMISLIGTYITFAKHSASLGNYVEMSSDSRYALERISRDVHGANSITNATTSSVSLTMPSDLDSVTVEYSYDSDAKTVTRSLTDTLGTTTSRVLLEDVESFNLDYYNRTGVDVTTSPSILNEAKSIQFNARLLRQVLRVDTSDYLISARFLIRNL